MRLKSGIILQFGLLILFICSCQNEKEFFPDINDKVGKIEKRTNCFFEENFIVESTKLLTLLDTSDRTALSTNEILAMQPIKKKFSISKCIESNGDYISTIDILHPNGMTLPNHKSLPNNTEVISRIIDQNGSLEFYDQYGITISTLQVDKSDIIDIYQNAYSLLNSDGSITDLNNYLTEASQNGKSITNINDRYVRIGEVEDEYSMYEVIDRQINQVVGQSFFKDGNLVRRVILTFECMTNGSFLKSKYELTIGQTPASNKSFKIEEHSSFTQF